MNKLQYLNLLKLRGIHDLKDRSIGLTIAEAVKNSGGEPTEAEMVVVNEMTMNHWLDKYLKLLKDYDLLKEQNAKLIDETIFLDALRAAGVDNWSGYEHAHEMMEEWQEND